MLLEQAVRVSEIILAFAFVLQSLEYLRGLQPEKSIAAIRLLLSLLLLVGIQPVWVELGLLLSSVFYLFRFQGPYNGGSDAMGILVLFSLFLSHLASTHFWQEIALGYLAFQLTFSYFQSGYIKVINVEWRNGRALQDVFSITAYPVSDKIRLWGKSTRLMCIMSWVVILFELAFPFSLLNQITFLIALVIAGIFHFANAWLFGLNRFFWIWPAGFPILFWFQSRVIFPFV
ncbi:HTTM domain-containing protein [Cellvibrio zantedeschiae]|uniref:HTTM domain-containing protein n=1 Tax=Cellvibrio zantedeschiae TaxID=1237077 RepID=A0ABQ3B199_9GAMM|nr:HTTM domain-containing protein [Cellvibrio zantedeschiae]GGY70375.1 HTTM domain-containing protein [Cellvibrio zantedeschiae]